jgi:hypothetical protein
MLARAHRTSRYTERGRTYRVESSVWIAEKNSIGLMKCASKPAATELRRSASLP